MSWQHIAGAANDIGVGSRDNVWCIGAGALAGGFNIFRWNGSGWVGMPGAARWIDVSVEGQAWVINSNHEMWIDQGHGWQGLPGAAMDIGVGRNSQAWIIGTNPVAGGYGIYHWNGANWQNVPGGGVRIAVSPEGIPWIVNSAGAIFRRDGSSWTAIPGPAATDIGVGPGGQVWIIGGPSAPGGFGIYRWLDGRFQQVEGGATHISVGGDGVPWIVKNNGGAMFRWTGPVGTTSPTPPAQTTPAPAPTPEIVISTVVFKGKMSGSQSDEYVEITNRGTGPADLSGWHLGADDAGQDFTFPAGTKLEAGQSIRVYTNEVHAETGGFSFGFGRAIWNDKGDVARLKDAGGKTVAEFGYGDKATMTTSA